MKVASLFILVFFPLSNSRPVDHSRPADEVDSTPPLKKAKDENCFFSQLQKTAYETKPRPAKSQVSVDCKGKTMRVSDFFKTSLNPKTGEANASALLLCRGMGECELDFDNAEVVEKWKDVPICQHHADELLLKWGDSHSHRYNHIYREKHHGVNIESCSMPEELAPSHSLRPYSKLRILTIQDSTAILKNEGLLVHPGIPICKTHENELAKLMKTDEPAPKRSCYFKNSYANLDEDSCSSDPDVLFPQAPSKSSNPAADAVYHLAKYAKVSRVCYPQKPFCDLEEDSQYRKVCSVKKMINVVLNVAAPTDVENLRKRVFSKYEDRENWSTGSSKSLHEVLTQVSAQFLAAKDRPTRLVVIGLVAYHRSQESQESGAYHCASTIYSLQWIQQETGIKIDTYTFSEAQNGKGASDRAAAQVKYRAERYVAQGNDILTSEQFFLAMTHGKILNGFSFHHGSWTGISNLNHFKVEDTGLRAFRYGGIGEGSELPKESLLPNEGSQLFSDAGYSADHVDPAKERQAVLDDTQTQFWYYLECLGKKTCAAESDETRPEIDDAPPNDAVIGNLFPCPEPGCSSTFLKYSNLEKHILRDKHKISPERLTLRDYALKQYAETLEEVEKDHTSIFAKDALIQLQETSDQTSLTEGFAFPIKQERKPFGEKVIKWLVARFDEGLAKKAKPMDPMVVAQRMETERDAKDQLMFSADERKTYRQIAGFFSRLAAQRRETGRTKRSTDETWDWKSLEYVPDEDEHDDAEWLRWEKDEARETTADAYFNETVHSDVFEY